jgi:iron complex outermembrane receptor protein
MARRIARALIAATLPLACCIEAKAQDTIALPQINVRAPSPIVRRAPAPPAARPTQPTPAPAPTGETLQGTLPVVTDQFATVTVLPREEIQRSPSATLGDLLFSKPGITGSSLAPGAASRPIIRGLDVNRVGIVDNGIGSGGMSDLGETTSCRSIRWRPNRSR